MVRLTLGEPMSQEPRTHLRFRIEPHLQKQLEKARKESGRTLTAEITERLKKSFVSDEASGGLNRLHEELRAGLAYVHADLTNLREKMMEEIRRELADFKIGIAGEIDGRDPPRAKQPTNGSRAEEG
jgi:hypothetical protein